MVFRVLKLIIQTLAVGVNLPAHLVIIKGTQTWAGAANGMREYSDVDIQQMMGRAGRPQYDNSGTVIIMCEKSKVGMVSPAISFLMMGAEAHPAVSPENLLADCAGKLPSHQPV
jgi:superfamily II RNA helicase